MLICPTEGVGWWSPGGGKHFNKAIAKKLVGDHPFCYKEVDGVFFFFFFRNWYECGSEDKDFIYFRTCI